MKVASIIAVVSITFNVQAGASVLFQPLKVDYDDIVDERGSSRLDNMLEELSNVGMISVTNMPDWFREAKKDTLAWTHQCAEESDVTKDHTFPDRTRRRTMASHTIPDGMQSMDHGEGAACHAFEQASNKFRLGVDRLTRAFSARLGAAISHEAPLLKNEDGMVFETIEDAVVNGEHLEHFHSYQGSAPALHEESSTIEWHIDQGMFLVFTPGVFTGSLPKENANHGLGVTGGFYIELANGTRPEVQLDEHDDMVIILGDGINQYINPSLRGRKLRSVPHALTMPEHDNDMARVWYGRMILPPASAIHPEHGVTFDHLRQLLIHASTSPTKNEVAMSLGCSSESSDFTHARQLEESACEEGTLLCWHRCMSLEEYGVSDEICAEQNLDVWCINPRGQLWDKTHGDWFPGCVDSKTAPNATEYPRLPDYPRDEDTCTDAAYIDFVESKAQLYDFHADLMEGGTLYWSVEGDSINGMFSFNGLFGYTALGFVGNVDVHPMSSAIIIMATPSDSYSAVTGFDFDRAPIVEEYIIDSKEKAFRHWMTPLSTESRAVPLSNFSSYAVEETECFTAMTFYTPGIFNTTFNVKGTDTLIWAANGWDMFAGYHGTSRGVIQVEWTTGKVTLDEAREALKKVQGEGEMDVDVDSSHENGVENLEYDDVRGASGARAIAFGMLWALGLIVSF